MNANEPYTDAQLELLRRIERMGVSDEMRRDIREMREERGAFRSEKPEVVRGESRVKGFSLD